MSRRTQRGGKPRSKKAQQAQRRAQERNAATRAANNLNKVGNVFNAEEKDAVIENAPVNNRIPGKPNPNSFNTPPPKNVPVSEKVVNNRFEEVTFNNHPKVKYWHNKESNNRQWYPPGSTVNNDPSIEVNAANLPSGWKKYKHRNNNVEPPLYWYTNNTGNVQWNLPAKEPNKPANKPANTSEPEQIANNANLPKPWQTWKQNGNIYYYNPNTDESTYNKPTVAAPQPPSNAAANVVANAAANATVTAVNNAFKPVMEKLDSVKAKLNELSKAVSAPAAGGGRRRKTRRNRRN